MAITDGSLIGSLFGYVRCRGFFDCTIPIDNFGGFFLWLGISIYMMKALYTLADEYFAPCQEMFSRWSKRHPDLFGVTFLALISSAPKFFLNLSATTILVSEAGFGTVIGSAIFNILVISGFICVFASTPSEPLLHVPCYPLLRDLGFFSLALIELAAMLADEEIKWYEGFIMILTYVGYCIYIYFNKRIMVRLGLLTAEEAFKSTEVQEVLPTETDGLVDQATEEHGVEAEDSTTVSPHHVTAAESELRFTAAPGPESKPEVPPSPKDFRSEVSPPSPLAPTLLREATSPTYADSNRTADSFKIHPDQERRKFLDDITKSASAFNKVPPYLKKNKAFAIEAARVNADVVTYLPQDFRQDPDVKLAAKACKAAKAEAKSAARLAEEAAAAAAEQARLQAEADAAEAELLRLEAEAAARAQAELEARMSEMASTDYTKLYDIPQGSTDLLPEELPPDDPFAFLTTQDPLSLLWSFIMPSPSISQWRVMCLALGFMMCCSYILLDCSLRAGTVIRIPPLVVGLIFVGPGLSIFDAVTSVAVAKQGEGDLAVANILSFSIFDVLIGLGLPWFLRGIAGKKVQFQGQFHNFIGDIIAVALILLAFISILLIDRLRHQRWSKEELPPFAFILTTRTSKIMFVGFVVYIISNLIAVGPGARGFP
jgi:Ca2+/Na+ antiporter